MTDRCNPIEADLLPVFAEHARVRAAMGEAYPHNLVPDYYYVTIPVDTSNTAVERIAGVYYLWASGEVCNGIGRHQEGGGRFPDTKTATAALQALRERLRGGAS